MRKDMRRFLEKSSLFLLLCWWPSLERQIFDRRPLKTEIIPSRDSAIDEAAASLPCSRHPNQSQPRLAQRPTSQGQRSHPRCPITKPSHVHPPLGKSHPSQTTTHPPHNRRSCPSHPNNLPFLWSPIHLPSALADIPT
jgi:hypothetical protein